MDISITDTEQKRQEEESNETSSVGCPNHLGIRSSGLPNGYICTFTHIYFDPPA